MKNRPIGVFDSGLGGLTVVRELKRLLPHEDIVYLGDTARVPYGTRSREIVTRFSLEDCAFLVKKKVKCIVIACNTSSALASEAVKQEIKLPIFEVISPASEDAAKSTKIKKVGVIGTRATIGSEAYKSQLKNLDSKIKVYQDACPLFVPFIEEGEVKGKLLENLVKKDLKKIKQSGADTLILGCTHYPIISGVIREELEGKVKLINPGVSISKKVKEYLGAHKLQKSHNKRGGLTFYVTDLTPRFVKVAEMFLEESLNDKIRKVDLN